MPNKQLPNVLLEGASSTWTRLFFNLVWIERRIAPAHRHAM